MGKFGDFVSGLFWLVAGVVLMLGWEMVLNAVRRAHDVSWGRIGMSWGSERINRIFVRTVVTIVAIGFLLTGVGDLYRFFTGREWPLRDARWEDLWPF